MRPQDPATGPAVRVFSDGQPSPGLSDPDAGTSTWGTRGRALCEQAQDLLPGLAQTRRPLAGTGRVRRGRWAITPHGPSWPGGR